MQSIPISRNTQRKVSTTVETQRYDRLLPPHANIQVKADGQCRLSANDLHHSASSSNKVAFLRMMECYFAKWRHTVTLLHHYEARSYADYASGNHRWHIHRLHIVLRAVLCAAIFITFLCHLIIILLLIRKCSLFGVKQSYHFQ